MNKKVVDLKFKTRDGSSPKGKPRVYFSCHEEDFYLFEEIANDILQKQDCVIFYCDDFSENIDVEDLKFQLSQMQLFVVPITDTYLNTNSRAYDVEFSIAKQNDIPILPLMYGAGLQSLFNEKCGKLQYLNKYKEEETAISFDIKLTKFLSSVLISDELTKKVRDAFDKHIFLSYRKKDRFYANKLMKTIHKHDFF